MKNKFIYGLACIAAIALSGCGEQDHTTEVDETKANISVITFEGGVGDQWLKNAAKRFEEKNANRTDFQEGRTGVQILVKNSRSCGGPSIKETDLNDDIYFTESVDYFYMANNGKLADISDILTAENPEDGGKKIVDKIDPNFRDFLNRNGKYYAVPFYDSCYGIIYDKDLFLERSFYLKDDGSFTNNPAQFGTGPNGVKGDWDDGLPKSYDQFTAMMTKMVSSNVVPFTYGENANDYLWRALTNWWIDYEGYDDALLNYNFDGKAHHLVTSINDGVAEIEEVDINQQNGYMLTKQAGVYYALKFARDVLCSNTRFYDPASSNYDAQSNFINNKYIGGSTKPIAMLIEGPWWENEASEYFDEARTYGAESFNYGYMPIPKFNNVTGDATLISLNDSFGFIKANCEKMKLAKEFMQFLHTDKELSAFTAQTSMTRALNYKIQDEDKESVTTFGKCLVDIKESEHVKIVYPFSGLKFINDNPLTFSISEWPFGSTNYGHNPILSFSRNSSLTAEAWFIDHSTRINKERWDLLF